MNEPIIIERGSNHTNTFEALGVDLSLDTLTITFTWNDYSHTFSISGNSAGVVTVALTTAEIATMDNYLYDYEIKRVEPDTTETTPITGKAYFFTPTA